METAISAILCTHNGAGHLGKAIESLVNQSTPEEHYEIIIVDNCSTDSTKEVIDSFAKVKNIRYVHESTLGLSFARNAGWCHAQGKYVAYLDDDAVASTTWLERIVDAFESTRPRPGCIGGKVEPIWEVPRPPWVSDDLLLPLTIIDWCDTPQLLHDLNEKFLVGTNIAIPVEIMEEVGGFAPGLDRVGSNLLSNGDLFLQKQIMKAGYTCFYHPEIVVHHLTPKSRLNRRWFMRRYYWQGISNAAVQFIETKPSAIQRLQSIVFMSMRLLRSARKLIGLALPVSGPKHFTEKCLALITLGHIMGLLGAVKRRGRE